MVQPYLNNGTLIAITPLDFSVPPVNCYVHSKSNSQTSSLSMNKKNSPANTIADEFLQTILKG